MLVLQVTFHVKPEALDAFLAAGYEDYSRPTRWPTGCIT